MPRTLRALLVAVLVTGAVVAAVVLTQPPESVGDGPTYESTPLSAYDTSTVTVTRGAFCDAVPDEAVTEALGGKSESASGYGNGDRARITTQVRDVAHEFGCLWKAHGAVARAWVFAPPVTQRAARDLVDAARATAGCEAIADAPDFGRPSYGSVCAEGARQQATFRGLFGDAWLSCELLASGIPRDQLVDRTGRWCVAAAEAARAR